MCHNNAVPASDPAAVSASSSSAATGPGPHAVGEKPLQRPLEYGLVTGRYYAEIAEKPDAYFDEWTAMGLSWIRLEFEEYMTPGRSLAGQTAQYTAIIRAAHQRNIRVLGLVGVSAMADRTDFPFTDDAVERYIEAARRHLETYPVDAIEICNEPLGFLGEEGKRPDCLPRYAQVLIRTYEALKPLFPTVIFAAPVTANAEMGEWLGMDWRTSAIPDPELSIFNNRAMLDYRDSHGGRLPLDVISFHPYGTGGDAFGNFYFGRSFGKYLEAILAYTDLRGRPVVGDYPLWFTECGFDSREGGPQRQAALLGQFLRAAERVPQAETLYLYTWQDDEPVPDSEDKCFGLLYNSLEGRRRKPSCDVFAAFASRVGFTGDDPLSPFFAVYRALGGPAALGKPMDLVIRMPGLAYQTFWEPAAGESALLLLEKEARLLWLRGDGYRSFFEPYGFVAEGVTLSAEALGAYAASHPVCVCSIPNQ